MEHNQTDDLIETYLLHKLSPSEKAFVQRRISVDPEFAESIHAGEEVISYLEYLRNQQIREQLKKVDAQENRRQRTKSKRLLIAAGIVFLIIVGFWFSQRTFLQSENLAQKNLLPLHEEEALYLSPEDRALLMTAAEIFTEGDYREAARIFHHFAAFENEEFSLKAKWNVLICHLAMAGPNDRWMEEMRKLTDQLPEPLHSRGEKLRRLFTSPLFRIFSTESDSAISVLKPRLI